MEKSAQIIELKSVTKSRVEEQEKKFLYAQIGQQKEEIEFLKKKVASNTSQQRRKMIE
ncbi:hypothetical protein [Leadbetterella byssophila]|uniref:hypothetical protein n=1 Tax=Leadbetterella byssophila TaxID=316068 RepID=UPI0002D899EF|nr:hypothetical protein [Leadbetterella byssophila]